MNLNYIPGARFFTFHYGIIHPWEAMLAKEQPYSLEWNDRKLHSWEELMEAGAGEETEDLEVPKSSSCICCGACWC